MAETKTAQIVGKTPAKQIENLQAPKEISPAPVGKSLPSPKNAAQLGGGQKKLRIGLFSFTGCEGCMVEFLEILNAKYFQWAPLIDVVYSRLLKERTNRMDEMDVAFIEGAISSFKEEERLKEIRSKAKYVVAIGSCAISGAPNNYRNYFDEATLKEIAPVLKRFGHRLKVAAVHEIIKVDAIVPGCPILDSKFIEVTEKYMKEFGVLQ